MKISTNYSASGFGWVSASYVVTENTQDIPVVEAPEAPPVLEPTPPPDSSFGCALVSQDPLDGTIFSPSTGFETTWVLQNTSGATWDQAAYDLRYVAAAGDLALHQGYDIYDLTNNVEPTWTYNFTIPMIAPYEPGTYGELWEVVQGDQTICQFYVYIQVQ